MAENSVIEATPQRVGYLRAYLTGYAVICEDCAHVFDGSGVELTPIYAENLGRYRQPCLSCKHETNPNANNHWPVLFDGR
jgi:hypothetical protein